ncbi:monovalent cation/H+ antiporter subunit G [Thiosulfatimonas sediminis]|uniref:Monovalent cation/H+ antiporter subunit G n=1 Tax=Thiosulfatimonas sediminis TaxID=2675054 RepID=A0A6F8PRR6_9GAMM|nr:Na+/H+ antiporter subunit G [Thiosulfatimonas sediminis]BBP44680.1 monovalent cation/H+ antiporter subunit G [Thiosulfatimonas sediminis]
MPFWFEMLLSVLIVLAATLVLIGSWGLVKLPDFFTRLHGPTKASTLGAALVLIASAMYFSQRSGSLSLHEILISLFLFITAPVAAHLMAQVALHQQDKQPPIDKSLDPIDGDTSS